MGTELTVQPLPPTNPDGIDPKSHFIDTINESLDYALHERDDYDMVVLTISNDHKVGKAVGISFRKKD
jgi:hypothetical protein